jgi:hypothetical protein
VSTENKTNLILAIRGYKSVKKQKTNNLTDITVMDTLNKKILMRVLEPFGEEYVDFNDVKSMTESMKSDDYHSAILLSKKFTDTAVNEMEKQKIQYISDDNMMPFNIEELYSAIINCVSNQCLNKCGKDTSEKSECINAADLCRNRALAGNAKSHFEQGSVGLLKNDLKVALALNKQFLIYSPLESLSDN